MQCTHKKSIILSAKAKMQRDKRVLTALRPAQSLGEWTDTSRFVRVLSISSISTFVSVTPKDIFRRTLGQFLVCEVF